MLGRAVNGARRLALRTPTVPRRFASHGGADEVEKWKKISAGMFVLVVALSIKEYMYPEEHPHHDEHHAQPAYMKIRTKPYPWACSDCSLFDTECFKKCQEERKAQAAAAEE